MDKANAKRILAALDPAAKVVDVGGGGSPFPRADYVLDLTSYAERAALGGMDLDCEERFSPDTWVQMDVCDRRPWPFGDGFFDYAVCSHVLEDIRDPIWVCAEMSRVARAGYIEVPSRIIEQSRGVEHPLYAGFYHHRWLVEHDGGVLVFRHKPHSLHCLKGAIVADVGISRRLNLAHEFLSFEWTGTLKVREHIDFSEDEVNADLCRFAERARQIPDLLCDTSLSMSQRWRKRIYYRRLRRGRGV